MDPLGFLNNAIRRVGSALTPAARTITRVAPAAGDVLNTVLYRVAKPEASVGEALTYGAGTAAATKALSNLGPVRGVGPDFVVGAARMGTLVLPKEIGGPADTALAPFDPDTYIQRAAELLMRDGKLSPRSEEENRKIIQLYIPAGEAIRHYGLGGPGL